MSKRKLSKKQSLRIKKQQTELVEQLDHSTTDTPTFSGVVISHHGTQVEIEYIDEQHSTQNIRCHVRANLDSVVTGDRILWQAEDELGVIVSIEPRDSTLLRPDIYGTLRPVASNINQMVIVVAPEPEAFAGLIDRYLVAAENMQTEVLLLINKADLIESEKYRQLVELKNIYMTIGYRVLEVSAHTDLGFEALATALKDHTSIFVGQSGVGKSSLLQTLLPHESIRTGELSSGKAKGRHTTTHTQLYHFPSGGNCIDSPGIREFGLWHMSSQDITHGFVDLRDIAANCKFRNCQHEDEPGCKIKAAVEAGTLYKERFDSYKHILNSLDDVTIKNKNCRQY